MGVEDSLQALRFPLSYGPCFTIPREVFKGWTSGKNWSQSYRDKHVGENGCETDSTSKEKKKPQTLRALAPTGARDNTRAWIVSLSWKDGCDSILRWPPQKAKKHFILETEGKVTRTRGDESGAKLELKEGWDPDHSWSSPSPTHRRSIVPQSLQHEIRFRDLVIDSLDDLVPTDPPGCVSYYPLTTPAPDFICLEIENLKSNWIA